MPRLWTYELCGYSSNCVEPRQLFVGRKTKIKMEMNNLELNFKKKTEACAVQKNSDSREKNDTPDEIVEILQIPFHFCL